MAYTWQDEALAVLRVLLDDLDECTTYTDERLLKILTVSAFQVAQAALFSQTFVVDLTEQTITPDPTDRDGSTNDEDFVNLMCLKAACIINQGAANKAAGKAIAGSDMNAVKFDLKGVADSTLKLLDKSWCAIYKDELNNYLYNGSTVFGKAVMSPFRTQLRGYYGYNNI